MSSESIPILEWDDVYASIDFRLLWRFQRAQETVVVKARPIDSAVEVWTQAITLHGPETLSTEEFSSPDDLEPYLRALKEEFLAAGWEVVETMAERRWTNK
jgi:hypothetical protein